MDNVDIKAMRRQELRNGRDMLCFEALAQQGNDMAGFSFRMGAEWADSGTRTNIPRDNIL